MSKTKLFLVCSLLTFGLGGCGGGDTAVVDENKPKGIFTSSSDCAESGWLDLEKCSEVIDMAINSHQTDSKIYSNQRKCEAEAGEDLCERAIGNEYRPRLAAYLVTGGESPSAVPLYPSQSKEAGFVTAGGTTYLEADLAINFSKRAIAAYERFME